MKKFSKELAEICGIHAGDGYLRLRKTKGELDISGNIEERDYYDFHVIPLVNRYFDLNIKGRYFSRGTYGFVLYNKQVALFLNKLGFPFGKKSKVVGVPEFILKGNDKELYCGFLRGLFDTDGHLGFKNRRTGGSYCEFKKNYNYYPVVQITTISERLSKGVYFMLRELGLKCFIAGYQSKNPFESYRYVIVLSGKERLLKWMDLIGMKNPVKFSRFQVWEKFGFCPTNLNLFQREKILTGELDIYSVGVHGVRDNTAGFGPANRGSNPRGLV